MHIMHVQTLKKESHHVICEESGVFDRNRNKYSRFLSNFIINVGQLTKIFMDKWLLVKVSFKSTNNTVKKQTT